MSDNLTILMLVNNEKQWIKDRFIEGNWKLLKRPFLHITIGPEVKGFWKARKEGLKRVESEYVLNLDADTILPEDYIEEAIHLLNVNPQVYAVALDYQFPFTQGHLAFGTSVWRTEVLRRLYNFEPGDQCECIYMWNKIQGHLMTIKGMEAIHIKEERKID